MKPTKSASAKKVTTNGLNLGAFGTITPPVTKSSKKDYPVIDGSEDTKLMVDQFVKELDELKALTGSVEVLKAEIRNIAYPEWVRSNATRSDFVSSVVIPGTPKEEGKTEEVMVSFKDDYRTPINRDADKEAAVRAILGDAIFAELFEEKTTFDFAIGSIPVKSQLKFVADIVALVQKLNVDPSAITFNVKVDAIAVESRQEFVDGVVGLTQKIGLAPNAVVTPIQIRTPKAEFNQSRIKKLTVSQNLKLDEVYPTPSGVKVR